MENAIVTHRLTKYYSGQRAVDSLNLVVPKGCVYGLLGRNGSGKSTTIKMLLGMVRPDRGKGEIFGEPISDLRSETRARIAYMAEGHPLYGGMTISQIVAFSRPFYSRWNDDLADRILDHFELPKRKRIRSLSRGQKAQVALALAVAPDPELLILDDPTLGLDTVVRRDFLESLVRIIQRKGRTILFSSHVLGDVERVADRIGILDDGVLRVDCPTEHFKASLRKVVVEFGDEVPPPPSWEGVVGAFQAGNRMELVIAGYNGAHRAQIDALNPRRVEEIEMNLEDAFIEYTRKTRKPLPLFEESGVD